MSHRMARIGNVVRGVLARAIMSDLSDPRIEPLTSVTRVEVAPDLSVARVHVSVMAPEPRQRLTLQALEAARARLRGLMRPQLHVRQIPQLEFYLDDSIKRSIETVNRLDALTQSPSSDDAAASPPARSAQREQEQ